MYLVIKADILEKRGNKNHDKHILRRDLIYGRNNAIIRSISLTLGCEKPLWVVR